MISDEVLTYKVASLYYLEDMSQVEISEKIGISRPKVSRLLAKARREGIVNIQVNVPEISTEQLEMQIKNIFGVENVIVVPSLSDDTKQNLNYTAQMAGSFFQGLINNGDKIGVSWGYTLMKLAENLTSGNFPDSVVLQISGNLNNADSSNFANEIVQRFSERLNTENMFTLPCPVIVENPIIVDLLLHDSKISNIINQVNNIDIAFPNIDVLSEENCLWRTDYISTDEMHNLRKNGSVGSICSRFINENGEVVDQSIDQRTISLSLDSLKNARHSCICIAGENKVLPLLGCLRAGLVNTIVIDSIAAEFLIKCATNSLLE